MTDVHTEPADPDGTGLVEKGLGEREAADAPVARPPAGHFGLMAWARWGRRQLTSMRVALVLLFLLALASVPGSLLPQEGIDPAAVQEYYTAHKTLAPILSRLGLFNVFAAPWFAAIYLLLFVSLAGCVLPRAYRLGRSARAVPPRAPRNLARLPNSAPYQTGLSPDEASAVAAGFRAGRHCRLNRGQGWLSAEKEYRREVGNLLFHVAWNGGRLYLNLGGLF